MSGKPYAIKTELPNAKAKTFAFRKQRTMYGGNQIAEGERTALAKRRLGRAELKPHSKWDDGRPETELNFKFYRQATNKIVGISPKAATFLRRFF